jgi:hypothetical protein
LLQIDVALLRRERERAIAVPCDRAANRQVALRVGQRDVGGAEVVRQRVAVDRCAGRIERVCVVVRNAGVGRFDGPGAGRIACARVDRGTACNANLFASRDDRACRCASFGCARVELAADEDGAAVERDLAGAAVIYAWPG